MSPDSKRTCIFVIDDDPDMRELLTEVLGSKGYRVLDFDLGKDALAALSTTPAQLVICDLNMPGMNGLDIMASFKRIRPDLPVIIISAFGTPMISGRAKTKGASNFLAKPFELAELQAAIDQALQSGKAR